MAQITPIMIIIWRERLSKSSTQNRLTSSHLPWQPWNISQALKVGQTRPQSLFTVKEFYAFGIIKAPTILSKPPRGQLAQFPSDEGDHSTSKLTLQFFHQYFLLSFAALLSNCEAPAWSASARSSSSDSFWSRSSTLSTFTRIMSTTCRRKKSSSSCIGKELRK